MLNRNALIAAASLALASANLFAQPANDQPQQQQPQPPTAVQPPGSPASDRARVAADTSPANVSDEDQREIRRELGAIAAAALTPGKFTDLVVQFSVSSMPQRNAPTTRPANTTAQANPGGPGAETNASGQAAAERADFDNWIAQFQRDWRAKYGGDFQLQANADQVFNESFAQINTSDLGDTAQTAAAKIEPTPEVNSTAGQHTPNNAVTGNGAGGSLVTNAAAKNRNNDRHDAHNNANAGPYAGNPQGPNSRIDNRAVVLIEPSHGAEMATITLINVGNAQWRIDAPQGIDERQLRSALANHLAIIERDKGNWPSDQNEAYRMVAHHVFTAIGDAGAGLMQGGTVIPPGISSPADQQPSPRR